MRRPFILAVFCSLLNFNTLKAQSTFLHYYFGADSIAFQSSCLAVTPDSGFLIGGISAAINFHQQFTFIKTDSSGNEEWRAIDTIVGDNQLQNVSVNADGSFYFCGEYGLNACWGLRSNTGQLMWCKTYGGSGYLPQLLSIMPTSDGNVLVAGSTQERGANDILVIKSDTLGNIIWKIVYGDTINAGAQDIKETADSNYIISGTYSDSPQMQHVFLLKLGKMGDTLWFKTYSGIYAREVQVIQGGNIVVAGLAADSARNEGYLLQTDDTGSVLRERNFNNRPYDNSFYAVGSIDNADYLLDYITTDTAASFSIQKYVYSNDSLNNLRDFGIGGNLWPQTLKITSQNRLAVLYNPDGEPCFACAALMVTDTFGCTPELCTTSIPEFEKLLVHIYPNPFIDELMVEWNGINENEDVDIKLYDLTGRLLNHLRVARNREKISINGLAAGCYLIEINIGDKTLILKEIKAE